MLSKISIVINFPKEYKQTKNCCYFGFCHNVLWLRFSIINLINKQIVVMFITVTMSKANLLNDIYKDNYNDGIKQEDDCYKVLLNWCTTEHPKYHAKCRPKSRKQTNNVTWRVRRNPSAFIRKLWRNQSALQA